MATAILLLEDTEDGPIHMHLSWEGDYVPASPAHQHMRLLAAHMDKLCGGPIPDEEPKLNPIFDARRIEILGADGHVINN